MPRPLLALPLAALAAAAVASATPAAAFLGLGGKSAKPATPAANAAPAKTAPAKTEAKVRKATPAERAAADRLDPLSRAAFWNREADVDPTDLAARVSLASALRALGRYEEAVAAAGQVLVVAPAHYDALMETARAEIGRNRGFYALEPLKRAQAAQPRDWRAVSLQGVALEQSDRPAEAREAYARALQLSPNNPAVLSNLALSYASAGDRARAETLLRQAVAQPTATAQERQNLALVLGLQGRLAEAESLIRQDLPPESANNNIAWLKASSGAGAPGGRSWAGVKGAESATQR